MPTYRTLTPAMTRLTRKDDSAFDATRQKNDFSEQTEPEPAAIENTYETYLPPNDDPQKVTEHVYARLIEKFGDVPEVHIIGEYHLEYVVTGEKPTFETQLTYLEALNTLVPNESIQKTIKEMKQAKADGFAFIYE